MEVHLQSADMFVSRIVEAGRRDSGGRGGHVRQGQERKPGMDCSSDFKVFRTGLILGPTRQVGLSREERAALPQSLMGVGCWIADRERG